MAARLRDPQDHQQPPVGIDRPGRLFLCVHPTSVRNGCEPDSKPAFRGFDSFHRCYFPAHGQGIEELTTGYAICNFPGLRRSGRYELWASGKATSFGMRESGVRVPPARPGARRMLATGRAGAGNVPCAGNPQHIRCRAPNARGSTGESTCLRSRGLQVQVLPGVLCPKQKWAMHRDVAPAEAGSSPAGHPSTGGSGPIGRGSRFRTGRFGVRVPGAARTDSSNHAHRRTGAPERTTRQTGVGHT